MIWLTLLNRKSPDPPPPRPPPPPPHPIPNTHTTPSSPSTATFYGSSNTARVNADAKNAPPNTHTQFASYPTDFAMWKTLVPSNKCWKLLVIILTTVLGQTPKKQTSNTHTQKIYIKMKPTDRKPCESAWLQQPIMRWKIPAGGYKRLKYYVKI